MQLNFGVEGLENGKMKNVKNDKQKNSTKPKMAFDFIAARSITGHCK